MTQLELGHEQIKGLLTELGEELEQEGVRGELFLVGGAAMALAYNTRRMTTDVDAVFEPKQVIYSAAERIALRHPGLAPDWLNDGVKGFLPGPDPNARTAIETPGIVVTSASPEYLLALKVQAARLDRDDDDIRTLAGMCDARTADDVLAIAERIIGRARLAAKAQYIVQGLFPETAPET